MAIFTAYSLDELKYRVRNILGELEEGADGLFWTNFEIYDYINQSIFFCFNKIRWWANPWQDFYNRLSRYVISNPKEFKHLLKILSKPPVLQNPTDTIDIPPIFMMTIVNYAVYLAKNKDLKEDLTLFKQQTEEYIIQCRKFIENYVDTTVITEVVVPVQTVSTPTQIQLEPPAPSGLKAELTEEFTVKLTWNLIDRNRYEYLGYNVYRSETETGTYTKIAESLTTSEFIDENVSYNMTYYYYISVVYEFEGEIKEKTSQKVSIRIIEDIYGGYFKIDDFEGETLDLGKWVYGLFVGMPIDNRISVVQKNGRVFFEHSEATAGVMTFGLKDGGMIIPTKMFPVDSNLEIICSIYIDEEIKNLYTIQGRVEDSLGDQIVGVRLELRGEKTMTTYTDEYGVFIFSDVEEGNYTLTPYKEGYTFSPQEYRYTPLNENKSNQIFRGTLEE